MAAAPPTAAPGSMPPSTRVPRPTGSPWRWRARCPRRRHKAGHKMCPSVWAWASAEAAVARTPCRQRAKHPAQAPRQSPAWAGARIGDVLCHHVGAEVDIGTGDQIQASRGEEVGGDGRIGGGAPSRHDQNKARRRDEGKTKRAIGPECYGRSRAFVPTYSHTCATQQNRVKRQLAEAESSRFGLRCKAFLLGFPITERAFAVSRTPLEAL